MRERGRAALHGAACAWPQAALVPAPGVHGHAGAAAAQGLPDALHAPWWPAGLPHNAGRRLAEETEGSQEPTSYRTWIHVAALAL